MILGLVYLPHWIKTAGLLTLVNQDDDICTLEVNISWLFTLR
jgi:hypothetical protein